jgi:hypothetical protein
MRLSHAVRVGLKARLLISQKFTPEDRVHELVIVKVQQDDLLVIILLKV